MRGLKVILTDPCGVLGKLLVLGLARRAGLAK